MHSTLTISFFWKQILPLVLLPNVLNKSHFSGKPSTTSNGCTHALRKKSKANWFTREMVLFLNSVSAFVFVILRWAEKRAWSPKRCELLSPAMQTLPLGCPPHTPMHHGNYQPMVQVGETRCALRQKERLTTTVPQEAGGLYFTSH